MAKGGPEGALVAAALDLRRRLEERLGFPVEVWLFGSRAKGQGALDTDADLVVVVPHLEPEVEDAIADCAWEVGLDYDMVLSAVPTGRDEIPLLRVSPFWRAVLREGTRV